MDECILWQRVTQQIRETCTDLDGLWIKRRRLFDTEMILNGLLQLCGNRNQQSYQRVLNELNCQRLCPTAASSFCEARSKVPWYLISEVRKDMLDAWDAGNSQKADWHGFQTYAVDGSKLNLPRKLLKHEYKPSGTGHYPLGLASLLVRMCDQVVCDVRLSKNMDERDHAHEHLTHLSKNDLVVYDRGFLSLALLQAHQTQGTQALFRVAKEGSYLAVREFWRGEKLDCVVTIDPSTGARSNALKRYPAYEHKPIQLRLIKYEINSKIYVLATTILEQNIARQDFIDLYARRWQTSEETYKAFKKHLEVETFHSTTENGVKQELEVTAILWNMTRMLGSIADQVIKKTHPMPKLITLPNQYPPSSF
jgi:hypothetical protein